MSTINVFSLNTLLTDFELLNSELEAIGQEQITYIEGNEKECIVGLVNSLWHLISLEKDRVVKINNLNEKLLYANNRVISCDDKRKELNCMLKNEQSKLHESKVLLEKLKSEKDNLSSELKHLKTSLDILNSSMVKEKLIYEHDITKKDKLIEELRCKLFRILKHEGNYKIDKCSHSCNCKNSPESSVFNKYIDALQNNIQLLLSENFDLRTSFVQLYILILKRKDDKLKMNYIEENMLKYSHNALIQKVQNDLKDILST